MSRHKVGVWIKKLSFLILFGWYCLGVITIARFILPEDKGFSIQALSTIDTRFLALSFMFGFSLAVWGVANAYLNLKAVWKSRDRQFYFENAMDMFFCASIVLFPILAIYSHIYIQENFSPPVWHGVVGLFLIACSFHCLRAEHTRRAFLEQSCA
jgi:hypothetical protein